MSEQPISATSIAPRYSVVVPVFNEAGNIGSLCAAAIASLPPNYELLICYDFDGDSTLPALAALPAEQKPPGLRLVKNDLGRGRSLRDRSWNESRPRAGGARDHGRSFR